METGQEATPEVNGTEAVIDQDANTVSQTITQENTPDKESNAAVVIETVGSTETDGAGTGSKDNGTDISDDDIESKGDGVDSKGDVGSDSPKETDSVEVLKEGTVESHGSNKLLQLTVKSFKLQPPASASPGKKAKKHAQAIEIPWQDVIWASQNPKAPQATQDKSFTVHYMTHRKTALKKHSINLTANEEPADGWIKAIQEQCAKVEGRPKKLFVVINPIGGSGTALKVFQKKVTPILQLAQVSFDVVETQKAKHAIEIGETQDFSSYDGVMVVGGDGLYQEVLQGMTIQRQRAAGVNYDDVESKFVGLDKPVAIIPAGTGNGVANWINGTKDLETATLRVLRGEIHRSQIFTIHSNGKFFCLCGLLFAYGMFGDLMKQIEDRRWMKKARYPFGIFGLLFGKKRRIRYEVEYSLIADSLESSDDKQNEPSKQESGSGWQWVKHDSQGRDYVGIYSFVANPVDNGGDRYTQDIFTDRCRLFLDLGCSSVVGAKVIITALMGKKVQSYPRNIDVFDNVRGVRIKVARDEGEKEEELRGAAARARELDLYMDIDGEALKLEKPSVDIRVVPSFVPLYSCKVI